LRGGDPGQKSRAIAVHGSNIGHRPDGVLGRCC
jgi:hypothetical protein